MKDLYIEDIPVGVSPALYLEFLKLGYQLKNKPKEPIKLGLPRTNILDQQRRLFN